MIADFIVAYLKWAMNVIIKLFFVVIVALLIISIGTFTFSVDANAIFADVSVEQMVTSYFQHMPHIGMFAEGLLQLIGAAGIKVAAIESAIYAEILFCCIYMIIVRIFDATIQGLTRIFRRFMSMGKITTMLADAMVYIASYALAIGIADLLYDGIVRKIPANVACWIMAGCVILISVVLLVIQRKTILASFLNMIGGGFLDVLQLVLIYFAMMCMLIMDSATGTGYLNGSEQVMLTAFMFVALALLSISFIRRLLAEVK